MTTVPVRRDDLLLQRFLSLFLFFGAFFFGVATFVAATEVISGKLGSLGMLLGCGLPFAALAWIGMALWAGRGVPRWFIASFLVVVGFGPFVLALCSKTWDECWNLMAMAAPSAYFIYQPLREYWGKPAKPESHRES